MFKSVIYYSHTYYDVNGSLDAVTCDILIDGKRSVGELNIE